MKKTPELIEEEQQKTQGLPINRKMLFSNRFSKNYGVILYTSIFMTLFSLPLIIVFILAVAQIATSNAEGEQLILIQYQARTWFYFWSIPSLCVLSIGASGSFYVMKKLCWNESGKFIKDFGKGIKENAVKFLILTLLFSLFVTGVSYIVDLLTVNFNLGFFSVILIVLQAFLLLVSLAMLTFQYCGAVIYKTSVLQLIKNSFKLVFGTLPKTVAMLIVAFAPLLLLLITLKWWWAYVIVVTVMAAVGWGYTAFMSTLYCQYVYDKYVNKTQFPEIYRRGLFTASEGQPD